MPDDDIIDNTPGIPYDELTPEEQEIVDQAGEEGVIPHEWFIEQFVEHFGYAPTIKEWNYFTFYVLSDFDPEWRDRAIEVQHERP